MFKLSAISVVFALSLACTGVLRAQGQASATPAASGTAPATAAAGAAPAAHLPGELSAEDVLNGVYPYPPSPPMEWHDDSTGLDAQRLGKTPAPGVHPRILISPEELPDLRRRLRETETGRELMSTLHDRLDEALHKPGWGHDFYELLAAGDLHAVEDAIVKNSGLPGGIGHYQPFLMAMTLESLRCLIEEDKTAGARAATAAATYAQLADQILDLSNASPLYDDIWRMRIVPTGVTGKWTDNLTARDAVGYNLLGYDYDFAFNFMSDDQRATVRKVISKATKGKVWMGARLPHHFRDWNWVAIGMQTPVLALAIEGEEGYDPRVYQLGVQIARDYLTYAFSPSGMSTEAVGYTAFGQNWLNPMLVAASRRGEKLLTHSHHRALIDWYCQTLDPQGGKWTSHGDGGDGSPSSGTLQMFRYFFPTDPKVDFLWQNYVKSTEGKPFAGRPHMVESILWACDGPKGPDGQPVDYEGGAKLNLPLTWFDPVRSSLIVRNAWNANATKLEFECRTDSFSASHEHADRGNFNFASLGRDWAKENFRSIETRHHNGILIDGLGQGFWPGPGKWLGEKESPLGVMAACDAKECYDWVWPKELETEGPAFIRYHFERWRDYNIGNAALVKRYQGLTPERDNRPSVVAAWQGFNTIGDPRMWDEDTWPVRYPHNPVQRAFRTVAFIRKAHPYLLMVDDTQKDDKERLYEWLMQTGLNTEMASFKDGDIILCDATVARDANGVVTPRKGDRQLLVRILDMSDPVLDRDFQARPSVRLETFERKDTLLREVRGLSGARTFGLDKRLVIPSRSAAPNYKILLYPFYKGEELPVTSWNKDHTALTLTSDNQTEEISFKPNAAGRTEVQVTRGADSLALP